MKEIEKIALEFCRENDIEVTLSYDMPAGYETAYGTYDVTINTLLCLMSLMQIPLHMKRREKYAEIKQS